MLKLKDTEIAIGQETRRPISLLVVGLSYGGHAIKSWASTQQTIALSSGEAELYALTKATSQSMGILQMLKDFGIECDAEVYSDSTAAIGIVSRHGLGRTRHIKVQYLWLQEKILSREVEVKKVDGKEHIADLFTKYLKRDDLDKLDFHAFNDLVDRVYCIEFEGTKSFPHWDKATARASAFTWLHG